MEQQSIPEPKNTDKIPESRIYVGMSRKPDDILLPQHTHFMTHPTDPNQQILPIPRGELPYEVYRTETGNSRQIAEDQDTENEEERPLRRLNEIGIGGIGEGRDYNVSKRKHDSFYGPYSVWASRDSNTSDNYALELNPNTNNIASSFKIMTRNIHGTPTIADYVNVGQQRTGDDLINFIRFSASQEAYDPNILKSKTDMNEFHQLNIAKHTAYQNMAQKNGEVVIMGAQDKRIHPELIEVGKASFNVPRYQGSVDQEKLRATQRAKQEFRDAKTKVDNFNRLMYSLTD